jgi:membrane protease YdiL (CAAX protease family)
MFDAIPTPETKSRPSWLDLLLYLLGGFGLFAAAGFVFRGSLRQNSLASSSWVYALNVICFSGSVLIFGIWRKKIRPAELGIWPLRWRWSWLGYAVLLVMALYPARIVLGLAAEVLVKGNLSGLVNSERTQVIVPPGNLGINFIVTLFWVGLAAPFAEELYFRGALYSWFRDRSGRVWVGIVASTLLFSLGHADSAAVAASSLVLGAVNAWVFEKTHSIWASYAIHAINNSLAVVLVYTALMLKPGG